MPQWKASEIAKIVSGKMIGKDVTVDNVILDSRKASTNSLFIPLKGTRFDGHEFIQSAFNTGAIAAFSSKPESTGYARTIIQVDDTLDALQKLAVAHLKNVNPLVIGVTGSTGKTSTKEMMATILRESFPTFHSKGNFNSEQGLPLSLCQLEKHHEVAVLEMAMRGKGQIAELTIMAPPDIAVITNIGVTHIELLGSQKDIAQAKGEILTGLKPNGLAVLNGDDKWCRYLGDKYTGKKVYYGLESNNDLFATDVSVDQYGRYSFELRLKGERVTFGLPVTGRHHMYNALAGVAVGLALGMKAGQIAKGLSNYKTIAKRQRIISSRDFTIIDDTYNANPESMRAGLEQLKYLPDVTRRIAVLGDMLELGELSKRLHLELGEILLNYDVDILICRGGHATLIGEAAARAGFPQERIFYAKDNLHAVDLLRDVLRPKDGVLIKGSRGLKMEEIVMSLCRE